MEFYSDESPAPSVDEFDVSFVAGESPSWDYCTIYTSKTCNVRVLIQDYYSSTYPRILYRIAVTNDPTPKFYYDVLSVGRGLGG